MDGCGNPDATVVGRIGLGIFTRLAPSARIKGVSDGAVVDALGWRFL